MQRRTEDELPGVGGATAGIVGGSILSLAHSKAGSSYILVGHFFVSFSLTLTFFF